MPVKLAEADQMTIDEFLGYTRARPDGERWELIEGVAIMSPSPTDWHQIISGNIVSFLLVRKAATHAPWQPLIGIGTRVPVSPKSLPQPDAMVMEGPATGSSTTDDALLLFEVLSRSNSRADQAWRKRVYASVPNCQHYVVVATKAAEAVRYDRARGWLGVTSKGLDASLVLPAIGVAIPLRDIYRWTPIA